MANNPFDREVINPRERPLSSDVNLFGSYADLENRMLLDAQQLARVSPQNDASKSPRADGFYGDSFKVRPTVVPGNVVLITSGTGFQDGQSSVSPPDLVSAIGGIVGVNDLSRLKPMILTPSSAESTVGIAIPTGLGAGNSRIDIVEVRVNRLLGDPTSRDVLNIGTGTFAPGIVNKTLSYVLDGTAAIVQHPDVTTTAAIKYKKGVVAVTIDPTVPAVPATTPGYVKLAEIFVQENLATFDYNVIRDVRPMISPHGRVQINGRLTIHNNAGTIRAGIISLSAPPGVVVAAVGIPPAAAPGAQIIVAAGGIAGFNLVPSTGGWRPFPGTAPVGFDGVLASFFNISNSPAIVIASYGSLVNQFPAVLQATYLGATAVFPTKFAVNQPIFDVGITTGAALAPAQQSTVDFSFVLVRA